MKEPCLLLYGCSTRVLGRLKASKTLQTERLRERSPRQVLTNLTPGDPDFDGPHQGTRVNCQRQGPRARLRPTAAHCDLLPPELDDFQSRPVVPHRINSHIRVLRPIQSVLLTGVESSNWLCCKQLSLARSTPAPCWQNQLPSLRCRLHSCWLWSRFQSREPPLCWVTIKPSTIPHRPRASSSSNSSSKSEPLSLRTASYPSSSPAS